MIPQSLQHVFDVYSLNEQIKSQRSELNLAISRALSGSYSIKKQLGNLIDRMNVTLQSLLEVVEVSLIPKEDFNDFENSLVTLDEYADFETLYYYNELQKLKFYINGFQVALDQIKDTKAKPLINFGDNMKSGVLETLTEREFIEQGLENPVTEREQGFQFYTIRSGDTLNSIARDVYGDSSRFIEIAKINNLSESDLIDNDYSGITIKIPVVSLTATGNNPFNLVYEPIFDGTDQVKIDRYLYGRDIFLQNKKIQADALLDIRIIEGKMGLAANVKDRFDNRRGSLNPLHPEWGCFIAADYGQIPPIIILDRIITDMELQGVADPRIIEAKADYNSIRLVNDAVFISMNLLMIGGGTGSLDSKVPQ